MCTDGCLLDRVSVSSVDATTCHHSSLSSARPLPFENRRLAAVYGSIAAGVQCVLFADYNLPTEDKHVFTDLQLAYRNWLSRASNGVFYGDNKKNPGISTESGAATLNTSPQQQVNPHIDSAARPRGPHHS
jgi:hypothetical protein